MWKEELCDTVVEVRWVIFKRLRFLWALQGFFMNISSDVCGRPDPFLRHKQPSSFNFLCHVHICIVVGDCFESSLGNACCTALFNCDRAYSNTQSAFSIFQ